MPLRLMVHLAYVLNLRRRINLPFADTVLIVMVLILKIL